MHYAPLCCHKSCRCSREIQDRVKAMSLIAFLLYQTFSKQDTFQQHRTMAWQLSSSTVLLFVLCSKLIFHIRSRQSIYHSYIPPLTTQQCEDILRLLGGPCLHEHFHYRRSLLLRSSDIGNHWCSPSTSFQLLHPAFWRKIYNSSRRLQPAAKSWWFPSRGQVWGWCFY